MTVTIVSANQENMNSYGKKLSELRKETGVSGRKFADLIGVNWDQYKGWEYASKKKQFMPVEHILKVLPTFVSLGIDSKRVWELAGVTPDIFEKGERETTVKLSDGRIARGLDAEHYSDPTSMSLARYVGPGLEVIAEIDLGDSKPIEAYVFEKEGSAIALAPLHGRTRKPYLYTPEGQWYRGKAHTAKQAYNCRIVLVVREIATRHNAEYL